MSYKRRVHALQVSQSVDRDKLVQEIAEFIVPKNQAKCQFYLVDLVKRAKEIQTRKLEEK